MPIKYRSTRGKQHGLRFEEVILGGLATDRGLYVPESIPTFTIEEIEKVLTLHYRNLGDEVGKMVESGTLYLTTSISLKLDARNDLH